MESDAERGFGSAENDGEELSPVLTIMSLNRGMDSIVAKAGTLSTLAIDTTPFGCYPSMLLGVYEGRGHGRLGSSNVQCCRRRMIASFTRRWAGCSGLQ